MSPGGESSIDSLSILVIVPTYNEAETIQSVTDQVMSLGPNYQLLVVDDNSPDGTGAIVSAAIGSYSGRLHLITRKQKEGIGRAYVEGFRFALGRPADRIATMDADLSHDPRDLVRLVAATDEADLVLGSRYVPGGDTSGWPLHRRLLSRLGGLYARLVLGVAIHDLTGGFKVYRRAALRALDLDHIDSDGYVFQIETTYKTLCSGFRVVEVPIHFLERAAGTSKLSRRIVFEAMVVVWKLKIDRLLHRDR